MKVVLSSEDGAWWACRRGSLYGYARSSYPLTRCPSAVYASSTESARAPHARALHHDDPLNRVPWRLLRRPRVRDRAERLPNPGQYHAVCIDFPARRRERSPHGPGWSSTHCGCDTQDRSVKGSKPDEGKAVAQRESGEARCELLEPAYRFALALLIGSSAASHQSPESSSGNARTR